MKGKLFLAVSFLCLAGCPRSGPERAEVVGTVKLDGVAIEEGAIQFIPDEGTKGPSAGAPLAQGKYAIPRAMGVVVGKNRVVLNGNKKTGRRIQDPTRPPGTLTDEVVEAFPPQFNKESTLVREIKPGTNTLDFELTTEEK